MQLLSMVLLVFMGCASSPNIHTAVPRPPLRPSQLIGAWMGYDQDSVVFYRLLLENDGRGSCVVLCEDEFSGAYVVENWEVSGISLKLKLLPRTEKDEDLTMSVKFVDESEMQIIVRGRERDWEHTLVMHREDQTEANIRRCQDLHGSIFKQ